MMPMSDNVLAAEAASPMQPGATVDWAEMRALYCKGISLSDLSRKFNVSHGTIKARSSREKWRNTVARVNEHVLQAATDDLSASAKHWIGRIDRLMHAGLNHVEERVQKGKELRTQELQQLLDCAEKANRIARSNYGLDKQESTTHLHLGVINAAGLQHRQLAVVDVETVQMQAPEQQQLSEGSSSSSASSSTQAGQGQGQADT